MRIVRWPGGSWHVGHAVTRERTSARRMHHNVSGTPLSSRCFPHSTVILMLPARHCHPDASAEAEGSRASQGTTVAVGPDPSLWFRMTHGLRSFFPPRTQIRCAAERFARKMKSPALASAGPYIFTVGPAYPDFDLVGPSRIIRERSGHQRPGIIEGRASGFSLPPLVVTLAPCPSPGNQQGLWTEISSHGRQRIRAT